MWKIHLSANLNNYKDIENIFLNYIKLKNQKIEYKIYDKLYKEVLSIDANYKIANKYITIYPYNVKEFLKILFELYDILNNYKAPKIYTDIQLNTTPVHYRFGSFHDFFIVNKYGEIKRAIQLNSKFIIDPIEYNKYKPEKIIDPIIYLFNELKETYSRKYLINLNQEINKDKTKKIKDYTIIKTIHLTNKGGVYLAKKSNQKLIIKEYRKEVYYDKNTKVIELLNNELQISNYLNSIKTKKYFLIEPIIELFEDERSNYISRKYLNKKLTYNTSEFYHTKNQDYSLKLLRAIYEIHKNNVYLCDLKNDNIFIKNNKICFIDFENSINEKNPRQMFFNLHTPGFSNIFPNIPIKYKYKLIDYYSYSKILFFNFSNFIDNFSLEYKYKDNFIIKEYLISKSKFLKYLNIYNKLKDKDEPILTYKNKAKAIFENDKNINKLLEILETDNIEHDLNYLKLNIYLDLIDRIYKKIDYNKKYFFEFYYNTLVNMDPISIMTGLSGLNLSFIELFKFLKNQIDLSITNQKIKEKLPLIEEFIIKSRNNLLKYYEDPKIINRINSLFFGRLSALFALLYMNKNLANYINLKIIKENTNFILYQLANLKEGKFNNMTDITHGLAGYGLFLINLIDYLRKNSQDNVIYNLEQKVHYIFENIVNKIENIEDFWGIKGLKNSFFLGFAHGSAGIIYFILKYLLYFNIHYPQNQLLTNFSLQKINSIISSLINNIKYDPKNKEYFFYDIYNKKRRIGCYWCNGLAGISLIFPLLLNLKKTLNIELTINEGQIQKLINISINTIFKNLINLNIGFCHGNSGNLLILNTLLNNYPNSELLIKIINLLFFKIHYFIINYSKKEEKINFQDGFAGFIFSTLNKNFYDFI